MQKKPLLFLIPFFIILGVLFLIDDPVSTATVQDTTAEENNNTENTSADAAESENGTINTISYHLVVGATGSLEDGGKEPIYEEPDDESEEIAELEYNCAVIAEDVQLEEDWIAVDLKQKGTGYVKKENVEEVTVHFGSSNEVRQALIETSLSYLGLKFVRYGKSLTDGIDCSNFLSQIYETQGIEISNVPKQERDEGEIISEDEMEPGDIIYYYRANNGSGHVGMYLGDGFIINSSGHSGKTYPEGGVRIVRTLYPDRTEFQVVRYIDSEEDGEVSSDEE